MPNRQLTQTERELLFAPLLSDIRSRLIELSNGDEDLLWAWRRKLTKELGYEERSKPMHRKLLKLQKRVEQTNKCALCSGILPDTGAVLDRLEAMAGYTSQNTRLLCPGCDIEEQQRRNYS
jgi:hypothetical protein